jgi:AcrR family transcriptional regulator
VDEKRGYLPAAKRRSHILETARSMLADGTAFGADSLCTRAGISRATLYHYFSGPEAVRRELLQDLADAIERQIAQRPTLLPPGMSLRLPPEIIELAVRTSVHAIFSLALAQRETVLAALRSRNTDAESHAIVQRIQHSLIAALQADLEAGQAAGFVQVRDAALTARCLFAGLQALIEHALEEPIDLEVLVDTAVSLQLHGILVR